MATEFSRTLSLLRKERGVSQRVAAADLGVSQALLSHYENGIREPGLAFVSKVCDYYHVSADYMLGRTLARDGSMLTAEEILNAAEPSNVLQGSVLATLRGKLITSASGVLFGLLAAPPGCRRQHRLFCFARGGLRCRRRLRRGLSGPDGLRPCAGETVP